MESFKIWLENHEKQLAKQKKVTVQPEQDRPAISPWHQQKKN
jgi:hypothetical protein